MRYLLALLLCASPAFAGDRGDFFGTWGTDAQCARAPLIEGGTKLAEPFEISPPGWLRQGGLWCQLSWAPVEARDDGLFTAARAQCGEDAVRDYWLAFRLVDGALMMRWDIALMNGPLGRC